MSRLASSIKALLVCPGYQPLGYKEPQNRGLVVTLTGGRSVRVVVTPTGIVQRGASEYEYSMTQPLVDYYAAFLKGGNCPSAPTGLPTTHQLEMEHEGGGLDVVELPETRESNRIQALRGIVKEQQAQVVEGVLVDLYSAGTYLNVHGRINETNQAKFAAMDIVEAISKSYQVLAKAKANGK